MQDNVRAITPVSISGLIPGAPSTGMPIFEKIRPEQLFVDPSYQRDIGERGLRQIRRIVEGFDWARFKPPICAYANHEGKTVLKVLDGQHTAIAAASNPHIETIPVMIVEAEDTVSQAKAFIGQNTQNLGVTNLQLHQAAVAAGDEDALTLELTCKAANVRLLRAPNSQISDGSRQTIAVKQIEGLIARRGRIMARRVLEIIADAERGLITATHIKAVEFLLTDSEFADNVSGEDITSAIIDLLYTAEEDAKRFAETHRMPHWKALANVWYRKCKKRRGALRAA
ncbi:hypothetical protein [Shinella sp.]|uniref:hypothetical protein n=1 Tax=Shinella sp. TaxID=1870904 RepID=UPI00301BB9DC